MRRWTSGLVPALRRPLRITYWIMMGFFAIGTLLGLADMLPSLARRGGLLVPAYTRSSLGPVDRRRMASARLTASEIERAMTSPVEYELPEGVPIVTLDDLPAVLRRTRSGKPALIYFYCSLEEPVFGAPGMIRLLRINDGAIGALALRKAIENRPTGPSQARKQLPFTLLACRISRFAPADPETERILSRRLNQPVLASASLFYPNFFVLVRDGRIQGTLFNVTLMGTRKIPELVSDFRKWFRESMDVADTSGQGGSD